MKTSVLDLSRDPTVTGSRDRIHKSSSLACVCCGVEVRPAWWWWVTSRHWIMYSLVFIHNKAAPPGRSLWSCLAKTKVRKSERFYMKRALDISIPSRHWISPELTRQSTHFMSFLICKFNFPSCFITQLSIKQSIKLKPTTKSCYKIEGVRVSCPCLQVICKTSGGSQSEDTPSQTNVAWSAHLLKIIQDVSTQTRSQFRIPSKVPR